MNAGIPQLTIGGLARAAGVGVETIRYYQRRGLVEEPARTYGSIRRYGDADVQRLRFIRTAQDLGFSLDEVGELLRLSDGMACDDARRVATRKLATIRERRASLQRIEAVLADLVRRCQTESGTARCPLIDALEGGGRTEKSGRA
jgi:MerR family transcriptional regulator, mercuric resistance operon regulatory protein